MKYRKHVMYACYIVFVLAFCVIFTEVSGYFYGRFTFDGKYVACFLLINLSLVIFGVILGIPNIIDTVCRRGKLIFRTDKLFAVIPAVIYLIIYYTPLVNYMPDVLFNSTTNDLMCIALGILLTTVFKKIGIRYYKDL